MGRRSRRGFNNSGRLVARIGSMFLPSLTAPIAPYPPRLTTVDVPRRGPADGVQVLWRDRDRDRTSGTTRQVRQQGLGSPSDRLHLHIVDRQGWNAPKDAASGVEARDQVSYQRQTSDDDGAAPGAAGHEVRSGAARFGILDTTMNESGGPGDGELLDRITAGDTAAFEALYDRHSRVAFGLAYRIVGEPGLAEDTVQDAFLTVWRQAATYGSTRGSVRSWLLAIVHHRAVDYVRHRHDERHQDIEDMTVVPDTTDTGEQARLNVEGEQVRKALAQLPPDQQRSLTLAYFGGLTHDEIARQLGVPLGTVKGRLRIGLQKLRGYLRALEVEA